MPAVASDIFGDVAEGNVGEFLKFLPGVDVEYQDAETRGPRLGGLSPEYVGVTMYGAKMASADALGSYNGFINAPDAGRSMGFEQLSINSIESIEISRTIPADMDADSPAGNINLETKRGFDRKGRLIQWQFSITGVSDDFKWGKPRVRRSGESPGAPVGESERNLAGRCAVDLQRHNVNFDLNGTIRLTNRVSVFAQGQNTFNEPRTQYDPNPGTNLPTVLQEMINYRISCVRRGWAGAPASSSFCVGAFDHGARLAARPLT